jgi:hypothetical protein
LKEFEVSFRSTPNRFNGLYGAARAANLAGNQKAARLYYGKLLTLARDAESHRPEIAEARAFIGKAR